MRVSPWLVAFVLTTTAVGCSDEKNEDSKEEGGSFEDPTCLLANDTGGPGQYSDSCVQRSWIAEDVGTYRSSNCVLTIAAPSNGPQAVFTLELEDAEVGGTHAIEWAGGTSGAGNDSYYRYTTDATYEETRAFNYSAAESDGTEQRAIIFRHNLVLGGADLYTFTAAYQQVVLANYDTTGVDCGELIKDP